MPPANSPTETRPSTPPSQYSNLELNDPLTQSPYLQQLEEAISTPVPDLASTLNLTPSDQFVADDLAQPNLNTQARFEDPWDRDSNHELTRRENVLERVGGELSSTRRYLTESEFQRWPSESRRRVIMQSQMSRSREDSVVSPRTITRQNYSTTGNGPARQSLYDWAAIRRRSRSRSRNRESTTRDENEEEERETSLRISPTSENEQNARRDLDRALRNYRSARNALRSSRGNGYEIASVPTASALRALWNDELHSSATTTRQINNEISEEPEYAQYRMHRLERMRMEADRERERERERERRQVTYLSSMQMLSRERRTSEAFLTLRNTIRYLSELRNSDVKTGLELARSLGLDSLYECEDSNTPSNLPMTIDVLPVPQYSSWLTPGMTWQGIQSTDREQAHQPPILASTLRREMQREYLRRAMARRGIGNEVDNHTSSSSTTNTSLLDTERYLSDLLLQDGTSRWANQTQPSSSTTTETDKWPVKVTIHSVDYKKMTLTGTMSARHIPDKRSTNYAEHNPQGNSMESFFQGEIIDFRRHTLESTDSNGYKVGGVEIDAQYWQRIGPFKEVLKNIIQPASSSSSSSLKSDDNTVVSNNNNNNNTNTNTKESSNIIDNVNIEDSNITNQEKLNNQKDFKISQCLRNTKWIQDQLGEKWILMRWKEKCFVIPTTTTSSVNDGSTTEDNSNSNSNENDGGGSNSRFCTIPSSTSPMENNTSWGLTISGFYYIALNRFTGEIDGLYYDAESQPYQQLKMSPMVEEKKINFDGSTEKKSNHHVGIGLKSAFPSIEFR